MCDQRPNNQQEVAESPEVKELREFVNVLARADACEEAINKVGQYESLEDLYRNFDNPGMAMWYLMLAKGKTAVLKLTKILVLEYIKAKHKSIYEECKSLSLAKIGALLNTLPQNSVELLADIHILVSGSAKTSDTRDRAQWLVEDLLWYRNKASKAQSKRVLELVRANLSLEQFLTSARRMIRTPPVPQGR